MIEFIEEDRNVPNINSERFVSWVSEVVKEEAKQCGDLNFIVGGDEWLLDYNIKYLNHDYFTDIITFDYSADNAVSGDLLISLDRVFDNAVANNVPRETEFLRVCIHGVLHLCGYGDKLPDEVKVMREKEDLYLCKY